MVLFSTIDVGSVMFTQTNRQSKLNELDEANASIFKIDLFEYAMKN